MSDHWLARRAEAERGWFRKEHERQFGKPPKEETDEDLDKVLEKLREQAKIKVPERKYFEPTVLLPPPLEPVDWTGAPLALKCACPSGDCACTCKGNTLLPRKKIDFVPRYNWWGLQTIYWMLPCVKYPQPAGTLALKFADAAKTEWRFYRSEKGRKILIERGPEFCLSGCLKFFITDRKMEKNFTALITEIKANVNVDEPIEEEIQEDAGGLVQKKIFTDRICDQFRCTVSTQSQVDGDGEFLIGDYSHLLFGSTDENLWCDIDGKELHVAAYKDKPEDPCAFLNVSRTMNKLFHVAEIKERILKVKKNLISSIFEIPEKFNSRESQYECQDIPLELSEGVCESLADVRRKLKEKECLKRRLGESKLRENKLDESITDSSDETLSDNDEPVENMTETNLEATSLSVLERSWQTKDSHTPTDTSTSKDFINTPCNNSGRFSNVTKRVEDSQSLSINQANLRDSIASKSQKDMEAAYKSLTVDKKNVYENNIKSGLGNIDSSTLEKSQKVHDKLYRRNISRSSLSKANNKNEWMPCKSEIYCDKINLVESDPNGSIDSKLNKDYHNMVELDKSLSQIDINTGIENIDATKLVENQEFDDQPQKHFIPSLKLFNKLGKARITNEWMPCKLETNRDTSNTNMEVDENKTSVIKKSIMDIYEQDHLSLDAIEAKESPNPKNITTGQENIDHEKHEEVQKIVKTLLKSEIDKIGKVYIKNEWMPCMSEMYTDGNNLEITRLGESIDSRSENLVNSKVAQSKENFHKKSAIDRVDVNKINLHESKVSASSKPAKDTQSLILESNKIEFLQEEKISASFKGQQKVNVNEWMPCKNEMKPEPSHLEDIEIKQTAVINLAEEVIQSSKTTVEEDDSRKNRISKRESKTVERTLKNIEYSIQNESNCTSKTRSKLQDNEWMPCKSQIELDRHDLDEREANKSVNIKSGRYINQTDLIDDKPNIRSANSKSAKDITYAGQTSSENDKPKEIDNRKSSSELKSKGNPYSKSKEPFKDEPKRSITKRISQKSQNVIKTTKVQSNDNTDTKTDTKNFRTEPRRDIKYPKVNEWMPCKIPIEMDLNTAKGNKQKNDITCKCKEDTKNCWHKSETKSVDEQDIPKTVSKKGSKFSWKALFCSSSKVSKTPSMKNSDDMKLKSKCCTKCNSEPQKIARKIENIESEGMGNKQSNGKRTKVSSDIRKPPRDVAEQDPNDALKSDVEKYYRFYF